MNEIELLDSVLTKTTAVIAGARPDQGNEPTPCPDYDVATLINHLVGWIQVFDAGCNGQPAPENPGDLRAGPDPAAEFAAFAKSLVAGWAEHGFDRTVRITGSDMPAPMVFNMTVMEYFTHGWDLACATGQPVPYSEEEAELVLERAKGTLPPEYRGGHQAFGPEIPIADDAPAVDRMAAFMGRRP